MSADWKACLWKLLAALLAARDGRWGDSEIFLECAAEIEWVIKTALKGGLFDEYSLFQEIPCLPEPPVKDILLWGLAREPIEFLNEMLHAYIHV